MGCAGCGRRYRGGGRVSRNVTPATTTTPAATSYRYARGRRTYISSTRVKNVIKKPDDTVSTGEENTSDTDK